MEEEYNPHIDYNKLTILPSFCAKETIQDAKRYRWLRKEYSEGKETSLAECIATENQLDKYIDSKL